jgi:hypothetical protein
MDPSVDFGWLSLVQRRADYVRKSVTKARSPGVAKEFEDLAALYDDVLEGQGRLPARVRGISRTDPKSDLIRYLQARASQFLMDARNLSDPARADELKFLAGAFGAEAARLKNDTVR